MNKDVQSLIRRLRKIEGVEILGGQHPQVYLRGSYITTLPSTPSDTHWLQNTKATLRRLGIDIDEPRKRRRREERRHMQEPHRPLPAPQAPYVPDLEAPLPAAVVSIEREEVNVNVEKKKKQHSGGRPRIAKAAATRLRAEMVDLGAFFGAPEKGWIPRMVTAMYEFALTLDEKALIPKSRHSLEIGLRRFLLEQGSVSPERAKLFEVFTEHVLEGEEDQPIEFEPFEQPVSTERQYNESFVAQELIKIIKGDMAHYGKQGSARFPFGRGTVLGIAKQIITQANREGIVLREVEGSRKKATASVVSRRINEYIRFRKRGQPAKEYGHSPEMEDEMNLYLQLVTSYRRKKLMTADLAPVIAIPKSVSAPTLAETNGVLPRLFELIEGRALTRAELEEALSIVELEHEFLESHPSRA